MIRIIQISISAPRRNWVAAESAIIEATKEAGIQTITEYGEAAFYGPKLDFMVKDALGRSWQLGTIQVDYNLPERFDLTYIGEDNAKHRPIMIHRAPFGSFERFIGVLTEHCAGKFPLWLTPTQIILLPISNVFNDYAKVVQSALVKEGIRVEIDERHEKIGRKIRDAEVNKIPYMAILGEREMEENTVAIRQQGKGNIGTFSIEEWTNSMKKFAAISQD